MSGGPAGRLADAAIDARLTPLLLVAALGVGLWSVLGLPSREEPEIVVPVADLFLPMPGYTPEEVENRALIPLEEVLGGMEGVEYVYARAEPDFGLVTVRFEVGREMEASLVRLHSHLLENADRMPPGLAGFPLLRTVTIDDVPFFSVALHTAPTAPKGGRGSPVDARLLRRLAEELAVELEAVEGVRRVEVIGGRPREIRVELSPERMASLGVDPVLVAERLRQLDGRVSTASFRRGARRVRVRSGPFLRTAEDVEEVVLDVREGRLVQVRDVARVVDGPAEVESYTFHDVRGSRGRPMVTLAVARRPGADETELGRALEARLEELRGRLLPGEVEATVTRNYGESAREKVNTLRLHLLLAILAVGLVVALAMGWRAGLVVMTAVPVTFALTLLTYHLLDYSLNRVTLFALIFVTGIVVDDSIIVVENLHRHFRLGGRPRREAAREAVDEVGNPTILATLTVIAAVLPMLFVSGLMGPYMSPMPIGSTLAMSFSLLVALVGAPWLAYRLLGREEGEAPGRSAGLEETRSYRVYRAVMDPLLDRPSRLIWALGGVGVLLVLAVGAFALRMVSFRMLPFDDKNEIQILIDMPEGTTLESTAALAEALAGAALGVEEVAHVQRYVGTAAPFNFNGLVRHYYLRSGPTVADLQVNLEPREDRSTTSHEVALRLRPRMREVAERSGTGARVKVVEVPPGPPVLSTLVAEVYGRDRSLQIETARRVRELFRSEPGVVDVDWSLLAPQEEIRFEVDGEKAALSRVPRSRAVRSLAVGLGGEVPTHLAVPDARTALPVRIRLAEDRRSGAGALEELRILSQEGVPVPLGELATRTSGTAPQVIDRKNARRVVYVTAEVAGGHESPVFALQDLSRRVEGLEIPEAGAPGQLFTRQPRSVERPVLKWDGEWQITYEVFRDLGIAFAGALVLIYLLIVAWFGSLTTPLVMMAAIPLTLIGIVPGHRILGAFFTATSMIGMIALAGIMVRNGILLIDYLESRLREGVPLREAVLQAGGVRFRPIALTAGTVVIGAFVILFDPIFEGLAVSLMAGAVASTLLTLIVVPGLYYLLRRG